MDILGIGVPEIIFILLLAFIILGPKDMQKIGRTAGKWLRDFVRSDMWKVFRDTSDEIRNIPTRLMREANVEELKKEVQDVQKDLKNSVEAQTKEIKEAKSDLESWARQQKFTIDTPETPPAADEEHTIAPPTKNNDSTEDKSDKDNE
jgi:Sec-independent protein translocase protein TatA